MVDPIGTTIGAVSLAIQLLDGAVKGKHHRPAPKTVVSLTAISRESGYTFFLAVGDFPASCADMKTKLEVEQRRILDFADAAEILDYAEGRKIPSVLKKDHLVLGSVFNQIQAKLDSLAVYTSRYQELKPGVLEDDEDLDISALSAKEQYPTLVKWDQAEKKRAHIRGTNHIMKYYKIGKDVVKHPKRLRWTAFDEKAFAKTRLDLAGYNDFLHELLDGEYSRRLEDRTKKTYLEMVLVRNELKELKQLLVTSTVLSHYDHIDHGHANGADSASSNVLDVLADAKRRSVLGDFSNKDNKDKPPEYHELINVKKLEFKRIKLVERPTSDDVVRQRNRTAGD